MGKYAIITLIHSSSTSHLSIQRVSSMLQAGYILVVDDETDIVNLVVELLQDEGYEVRSAFNGEMALAAIAQQQPAMILIDMYMPQMTGIMLLDQMRTNGIS